MEQPKPMRSSTHETGTELSISTPKRKSAVLIFFLGLITLQFSNAIIQSLFFDDALPLVADLTIVLISLIILYFALRGLLWQLKGKTELVIDRHSLTLHKKAPLTSGKKFYKLSEIKSVQIKDESVAEGPTAMLQLLHITDKIKITMTYGYETIPIIGGIDITEATELKNRIQERIARSL